MSGPAPMPARAAGVALVDPSAIDRAAAAPDAAVRHRVDTAAVASRADFFDAVRDALPMAPRCSAGTAGTPSTTRCGAAWTRPPATPP
ncbi:hypothetical protein ACIQF6_22185 [Kitasatospora sp. NPDC092948]|uniref:hypothetical protein n=1 Tax=Kitasatospora sp. NPDC092948 TaxID=3364088 RepID=UPI0038179D12